MCMAETLNIQVDISNRLKILMAEVGCRSILELARETGISKGTLYNLEQGKNTNLTLENVFKLLWFFDCKFEELFQATINTDEPDSFDALAEDVQETILAGREEYAARHSGQEEPSKEDLLEKQIKIGASLKPIFTVRKKFKPLRRA